MQDPRLAAPPPTSKPSVAARHHRPRGQDEERALLRHLLGTLAEADDEPASPPIIRTSDAAWDDEKAIGDGRSRLYRE